jgi:hypothetical protein
MNDVQESGSFVVRLSNCMYPDPDVYSFPSCHISFPWTFDYRSHNNNYLSELRTEAIV